MNLSSGNAPYSRNIARTWSGLNGPRSLIYSFFFTFGLDTDATTIPPRTRRFLAGIQAPHPLLEPVFLSPSASISRHRLHCSDKHKLVEKKIKTPSRLGQEKCKNRISTFPGFQ
jgi:hypothetical protein